MQLRSPNLENGLHHSPHLETARAIENALAIDPGCPLTMSSKEIADLLDVRHDKVKRTIKTLMDKGVIGHPQFEDDLYIDAQGKERSVQVYQLEKRDSYIVVAQLSPEFTAGSCAHPEPKAAPIHTRSIISAERSKYSRHIVSTSLVPIWLQSPRF
ncbi:Rha family transcriptional regulator [Aliiroseovarius crassostreae]|uniref:Rha family transcriptional regulator n=1 Tax=Aliiroseovarius crassostreae TaxID=154981 RepID=UPI0022091140|nr:Rha family transcriptional regulator [Aliiroseovarius crassostreae]UWQ05930.1 Rha family transcriptional regulator [Aliiroseovarius crassostreae]